MSVAGVDIPGSPRQWKRISPGPSRVNFTAPQSERKSREGDGGVCPFLRYQSVGQIFSLCTDFVNRNLDLLKAENCRPSTECAFPVGDQWPLCGTNFYEA